MGRHADGYRIAWHRGIAHVRFRHAGYRYNISTGTRDPGKAATEARRIFTETTTGKTREVAASSSASLETLVTAWLASYTLDHDSRSAHNVMLIARAQWLPRWKSLGEITTGSAGDYARDRLQRVLRKTVLKELSALRVFLVWCEEHGLGAAPNVKAPAEKAPGKRSGPQRATANVWTDSEIEAVVALLPEWSKAGRGGKPAHRVRDYFAVMAQTGLRPVNLARLSVPQHYTKGIPELRIPPDVDKKNRHREEPLPLRPATVAILDRIAPDVGLIFGRHDYRHALAKAAKAVLGEARGKKMARYDMRHSFITHLAEVSTNIPGIQHLSGHRYASTTSRYIHSSRAAAQDVLDTFSGSIRAPSGVSGSPASASQNRKTP